MCVSCVFVCERETFQMYLLTQPDLSVFECVVILAFN